MNSQENSNLINISLNEKNQETLEQKFEHNKKEDEELIWNMFEDPTYNITFKMLFSDKNNTDMLMSILNNLLGFYGENEIKEVNFVPWHLLPFHSAAFQTIIELNCKIKSGKNILVQMQRKYRNYDKPRYNNFTAINYSKHLAQPAQNEQLSDAYSLVILKEGLYPLLNSSNAFKGDSDSNYEKTVINSVAADEPNKFTVESNNNVLSCKFYCLSNFEAFLKKNPKKNLDVKEQWLDFLANCRKKKAIPPNTNEAIKKGYEIMQKCLWDSNKEITIWREIQKEYYEVLNLNEEFKKGYEKGKLKGSLYAEISMIQFLSEQNYPKEEIKKKVKLIGQKRYREDLDIPIQYIIDHPEKTENEICENLKLLTEENELSS